MPSEVASCMGAQAWGRCPGSVPAWCQYLYLLGTPGHVFSRRVCFILAFSPGERVGKVLWSAPFRGGDGQRGQRGPERTHHSGLTAVWSLPARDGAQPLPHCRPEGVLGEVQCCSGYVTGDMCKVRLGTDVWTFLAGFASYLHSATLLHSLSQTPPRGIGILSPACPSSHLLFLCRNRCFRGGGS